MLGADKHALPRIGPLASGRHDAKVYAAVFLLPAAPEEASALRLLRRCTAAANPLTAVSWRGALATESLAGVRDYPEAGRYRIVVEEAQGDMQERYLPVALQNLGDWNRKNLRRGDSHEKVTSVPGLPGVPSAAWTVTRGERRRQGSAWAARTMILPLSQIAVLSSPCNSGQRAFLITLAVAQSVERWNVAPETAVQIRSANLSSLHDGPAYSGGQPVLLLRSGGPKAGNRRPSFRGAGWAMNREPNSGTEAKCARLGNSIHRSASLSPMVLQRGLLRFDFLPAGLATRPQRGSLARRRPARVPRRSAGKAARPLTPPVAVRFSNQEQQRTAGKMPTDHHGWRRSDARTDYGRHVFFLLHRGDFDACAFTTRSGTDRDRVAWWRDRRTGGVRLLQRRKARLFCAEHCTDLARRVVRSVRRWRATTATLPALTLPTE